MDYVLVLSTLALFAVASLSLPQRWSILRWPLALLAGCFLLLFIGLRHKIGADWPTYELMYTTISRDSLLTGIILTEPGYALCNYFAHYVGGGIYTVNLICAFVLIGSLLKFAGLVEIDPSLCLFLSAPYLLFVVGMGYTRQSVAIGLGMCAIGYLRNGRYRMFYFIASMAVLFHYSAAVLIALVWLRTWLRFLLVGLCAFTLRGTLMAFISAPRYGQYVQEQSAGVWFRLGIILCGVAAVVLFRQHWKEDVELYRLIKKASIVFLVLIPLAIGHSTLVDRLSLYFFFIFICGFGRAIKYTKPAFQGVTAVLLTAISYGVFAVWFSVSHYAAHYWLPYRSIVRLWG